MKIHLKKYGLTNHKGVKFSLIFLALEFLLSIFSILIRANNDQSLHTNEIGLPPLSTGHNLGTDQLGRDVLMQLFLGMQNTFLISLISVSLACLAGVFLGCISGYYGDNQLKIKKRNFVSVALSLIAIFFFSFQFSSFRLSWAVDILIPILLVSIILFFSLWLIKKNQVSVIPFDLYFVRFVEIYTTLPPIFIIILLSAIYRPSPVLFVVYSLMSLWPDFFMISRGEMLKHKNSTFVDAARAIGQRKSKIIFHHILPNILSPVLVLFTFGFATLMVVESTLSFLGIGLPIEYPGWGKLIASYRDHTDYWWLLIFPGLLIFANVYCIQKVGRHFQKL